MKAAGRTALQWGWLPILVLLFLLPTLLPEQRFLIHITTISLIYAIPAVGLNLMLGYTGLLSLGHSGFVGVGGYTVAVLTVDAGVNYWVALLLAMVTSGAAGAAIGVLALRLRGHFFIIVTLAFGMVLFTIMNNWDGVTRGAYGLPGIPRPDAIALFGNEFAFRKLNNFFYLTLSITALVFVVQRLIVRSNFGRTLLAIRQDERLAAAKGVNTLAYRLAVFIIGSAIGGLGGGLLVSFLRVASPLSFDLLESINLVLIVIVGGAGFLSGPALGAVLFIGLPEYLRVARELRLVIFGLILVLVTLFARKGLAGVLERLSRRFEAG